MSQQNSGGGLVSQSYDQSLSLFKFFRNEMFLQKKVSTGKINEAAPTQGPQKSAVKTLFKTSSSN